MGGNAVAQYDDLDNNDATPVSPELVQIYRDGNTLSRTWTYGGYIQDNYSRGKLRLNMGLRYDFQDGKTLGTCVPASTFAPDILRRVRLEDAIKAKKLKDALKEMAEEGVVQLFTPLDGTPPVVGVIGALQLDVLGDRLTHEYGLTTGFDPAPCEVMRWIEAPDRAKLTSFIAAGSGAGAHPSRPLDLSPLRDRRPKGFMGGHAMSAPDGVQRLSGPP